ncbi:hypothetical protein HNR40_001827 [Nonomuraea endophytica]|uniref:Uncharacterized protein n=1 Tax=Nonomuraea endophytica TaxID=714136 RepID=A0A7W7ZYW4_9ACTN|nr:hypothetical protein [Nonomuraea endophytica]MBB5076363.1 hypothetical protein [Nonomuraea endophytica]
MVDLSGAEPGHQIGPSGHRADRPASRQRLAVHGEVGCHAEVPRGTAECEPEPRDDLVEDEHGAGPVRQLAHQVEEAGPGRDGARVAHHRLADDGGDLGAVPVEQRGEGLGVVEGDHQPVGESAGDRALSAASIAVGRTKPGPSPYMAVIAVPVVAP